MTLKQAVEKHRKWLEVYSVLSRLMGWLLVVAGIGNLGYLAWILIKDTAQSDAMFVGFSPDRIPSVKFWMIVHEPFFPMILPGLLALLVAQLLRYLLDETIRPGWFLRHGEKVLYFTAAVLLINFAPTLRTLGSGDGIIILAYILGGIDPSILLVSAELAILIGLAQALRRVLPMIEEAKSLV
jgi:hypothetical protein